ncbi:hypothetical protein I79_004010 [Cricetulus griseus]|uniref:Uncharacterized protein n=1 Tax=Cricetulus griseus TaxID=10029 RepID=G3H1I5_CRIGR|nr:hypothetical protein I79_004010 [Cricetulus griseus]
MLSWQMWQYCNCGCLKDLFFLSHSRSCSCGLSQVLCLKCFQRKAVHHHLEIKKPSVTVQRVKDGVIASYCGVGQGGRGQNA